MVVEFPNKKERYIVYFSGYYIVTKVELNDKYQILILL